jgi:DNA mismatch endonuclease (patch repair protein)
MPHKVVKDRKAMIQNRRDPLTVFERSTHMAKVKGKGNASTEMKVAARLVQSGIRGWTRHPANVPGRPDFCFLAERVAIFVDGCFWHGCPQCARNTPRSRAQFWRDKISANRRRDRKVKRLLNAQGFATVRIWEHALKDDRWLIQLRRVIRAARSNY